MSAIRDSPNAKLSTLWSDSPHLPWPSGGPIEPERESELDPSWGALGARRQLDRFWRGFEGHLESPSGHVEGLETHLGGLEELLEGTWEALGSAFRARGEHSQSRKNRLETSGEAEHEKRESHSVSKHLLLICKPPGP